MFKNQDDTWGLKMKLNMGLKTLRQKIVAIGMVQLILMSAVLLSLYARESADKAVAQQLEKSKAIILNTESMREEMGRKWDQGIFTKEDMSQWAQDGEMDKVLSAVPVVTAWQAAMAKSIEGNYQFKVPKFSPRNPDNEPDELEARAINLMKDNDLDDYYEIDKSINAVRYFRPVKLTQECMLCHGNPTTSQELWGNSQGLDPTGVKMENWKVGEIHGAFEVIQSLDAAEAQARSSIAKGSLLVLLLVAGGSAMFFLLVTHSVSNPVRNTVEVIKKIAKGDLTQTIPVHGKDEIGQLASSLNEMTTDLRQAMTQIGHNAGSLSSSSVQLNSTAQQLATGAEQTTEQSAMVASSAEELSVNMKNMSDSAANMSENIRVVSTSLDQMTEAIGEVATSAENAAQVADRAANLASESNRNISELNVASGEIGNVLDIILDIAEQTNLLALNATIEAARAGEAGKGFAVVANEVKDLARQTAEATEDIGKRIKAIQSTTGLAVDSIAEIEEVVKQVNDFSRTIASAVEEQSATTQEISRNIAQTAEASQVVSNNVEEMSIATSEITGNIVKVDANAKTNAQNASETYAAGETMNRLSRELQELTQKFTV